MNIVAFNGPAGSGKTHRLMDELAVELGRRRLAPHQRVLAVTFMHGSRRRLDERLRGVAGLGRNFEATTLDSFVGGSRSAGDGLPCIWDSPSPRGKNLTAPVNWRRCYLATSKCGHGSQ